MAEIKEFEKLKLKFTAKMLYQLKLCHYFCRKSDKCERGKIPEVVCENYIYELATKAVLKR